MTWSWKDEQCQLENNDPEKTFSVYSLGSNRSESSQNGRFSYNIYLLVGKKNKKYYLEQVHILIHTFCLSYSPWVPALKM